MNPNATTEKSDPLLTTAELAASLKVGKHTVLRWVKNGVLRPALRTGEGRIIRYWLADTLAQIKEHEESQKPQWSHSPTLATAHLVTKGKLRAACGAAAPRPELWQPAEPDKGKCRQCLSIGKERRWIPPSLTSKTAPNHA